MTIEEAKKELEHSYECAAEEHGKWSQLAQAYDHALFLLDKLTPDTQAQEMKENRTMSWDKIESFQCVCRVCDKPLNSMVENSTQDREHHRIKVEVCPVCGPAISRKAWGSLHCEDCPCMSNGEFCRLSQDALLIHDPKAWWCYLGREIMTRGKRGSW